MADSPSNKMRVAEFGDFQTPTDLARQLMAVIQQSGFVPSSILEPTCGIGNILFAAMDTFPGIQKSVGVEINPNYAGVAHERSHERHLEGRTTIRCGSFFDLDWPTQVAELPEPLLVIGNPPWVTNSRLATLGSSNLPRKSNFQNQTGFDAITGKSNFDISEWMLIRLLKLLHGRIALLAMLCKTAVARKVLAHAWKHSLSMESSSIYTIDAAVHFDAAVEACFLLCKIGRTISSPDCAVYDSLDAERPSRTLGYHNGQLVADVTLYERWKHLQGPERRPWRSGIKHDCSPVMEVRKFGPEFTNGLKEVVELENDYLYPMLKSSELASGAEPSRHMIVTQQTIGQDTSTLQHAAPKTWRYLTCHAEMLNRRASSIYRDKPPFSIFGVGPYSLAPWKVAISGFYKRLVFRVLGPINGKPVVLDDTSNFLPCDTREEAEHFSSLLNSTPAREFFQSFVFWDAKRPITIDLLRRLDLLSIARELGMESKTREFVGTGAGSMRKGRPSRVLEPGLFP